MKNTGIVGTIDTRAKDQELDVESNSPMEWTGLATMLKLMTAAFDFGI